MAPQNELERFALLQAYASKIEGKLTEIWAGNLGLSQSDKDDCYDQLIAATRAYLKKISDLGKDCQDKKLQPESEPECRDGYEPCGDGVCRVWCS